MERAQENGMGRAQEKISMNTLEIKRFLKPLRFVSCAVALAISTPAFGDEEKPDGNDPLEPLNRLTSGFNALLRNTIIDPVVDMYQLVTPDPLENVISNAASNLTEPLTIGSSLLQGDTENTGISTHRWRGGAWGPCDGNGIAATSRRFRPSHGRQWGRARPTSGFANFGPQQLSRCGGRYSIRDRLPHAIGRERRQRRG